MDFDGIIFDLDGTLWDSTGAICETWNMILKKHPEISREPVTKKELFECMGLPMYDIAARLFPKEKEEMQRALMDELCEVENRYLAAHGGILFSGLETVLSVLKEKYPLYIVSNCQDGYIESFIKAHNLADCFADTECWGRTRLPKGESNRLLMERNHLQNAVYVGDTASDAQSAKDAGIPFIYAAYGFGEVPLQDYDYRINDIRELPELLGLDGTEK